MTVKKILMGNEAIGRGLIEAGVEVVAAYPGTPSSEILESAAAYAREAGASVHAEWSVNEKVAFETALAAAMAGKRAATAMKQVGLNVASDPFLRAAYLGVTGGFVVVSADDPGPHSSQTEQDSRLFALLAKVPVLDPQSPREAREMVARAFELSERHQIPVMLRPTTRVCHARQDVDLSVAAERTTRPADFRRDPKRWCATPAAVRELHGRLNEKIALIAREEMFAPVLHRGDGTHPGVAVVASGVAFAHAADALADLGLSGKIDLWQVIMPYPLNEDFITQMAALDARVLVLEETDTVIEMQLADPRVDGRRSGHVPGEGELTPDVIRGVLEEFLGLPATSLPEAGPPGPRPTLCAGCGHRAAFYALRHVFPQGILPGDIGCYTLGLNLGAVDSCHCMGAGISQAAGFWQAYRLDGGAPPAIAATIGDSTFFHSGVPALMNAVVQGARIVVVILDNRTTAMTGHQPTPAHGLGAGGEAGLVSIPDLVRACGVRFLREVDPWNLPALTGILREAHAWCRSEDGGPAVVIARRTCLLDRRGPREKGTITVAVGEKCTGCRICLVRFECPAIRWVEADKKAVIDAGACTRCGVCLHVCPFGAIGEVQP
jgi:indolepyruvate ferredoxin oxidoreductase alpha subunit